MNTFRKICSMVLVVTMMLNLIPSYGNNMITKEAGLVINSDYQVLVSDYSIGMGGPATEANIQPDAIARGPNGHMYVVDSHCDQIFRIDKDSNRVTVFAGTGKEGQSGDGGPAKNAQLLNPTDLVFDSTGENLYFLEGDNNKVIRKIEMSTNLISTVLNFNFKWPQPSGWAVTDIDLDQSNNIYFAVAGNPPSIYKWVQTEANPEKILDSSSDVMVIIFTLDNQANVYVADRTKIMKYDAISKTISRFAGSDTYGYSGDGGSAQNALLQSPRKLDVYNNNLYISSIGNNVIRRINLDTEIISTVAGNGSKGFSGDGGPALDAELSYPCGIVLDQEDNLFIADKDNLRIRKVSIDGNIATVAGLGPYYGDGINALGAVISGAEDIAVDSKDNIYFSDAANHVIRKVDFQTKVITTVAGNSQAGYEGDGGLATLAQLNTPAGLAIDQSDNLYIADRGNTVIRKVNTTTGTISTFAGTGTAGYTGDGIQANTSALNYPNDIEVDGLGNLIIADTYNNRIRCVEPSGTITTIAGTGQMGYTGDSDLANTLWYIPSTR
jgi:streptogramin lyase